MDLSSLDPLRPADLSKTFSAARTCSHSGAMDLVKKPEWYHRHQAGPEAGSPFRCRTAEQQLYQRVQTGRWHQGCLGPGRSGSPPPDSSDSDSDVIFLVSSSEEPLLVAPFLQDSVDMLEPLSPAASSLDEGPRCYHPLSSPSPDSSYSEESSDSSLDVLLHRSRPVVLLSELGAVYQNRPESSLEASSEDSDVIQVEEEQAPPTEVRRSGRLRTSVPETPADVCGTSRKRLKRRAKKEEAGLYYESGDSEDVLQFVSRLSSSDTEAPPTSLPTGGRSPPRDGSETVRRGRSNRPTNRTEGGKTGGFTNQPSQNPKTGNRKPRRRRRKTRRLQVGPPAGGEPEVRLRHSGQKEQKKKKDVGFCPFVHVDTRTCVIVNFQEDEDSVRSRVGARPGPPSLPAFLPHSSCLQLCRCSSEGRQGALRCCLCGQTANAGGLGDLHGPYRPLGPSTGLRDHNGWAQGDAGPEPEVPPERWVHEDCGVWAAGVFLVRGRLYGLEEAARLAQDTVSRRVEDQLGKGRSYSGRSPVFASSRCAPCANRPGQLWDVS